MLSSDVPRVSVHSGELQGINREGVLEFLGIPYAGPISGADRFGPPTPATPWKGVRDASLPGPAAPQIGTAGDVGRDSLSSRPQGAECLNLNVRTKDLSPGKPVLVWFHGGGLFASSNAEAQLTTGAFAADGIVEVTANYRLGMFGYMSLGDETNANRGLLDQIAALTWVRDNIEAFGGDPSRVTIGGHSAGGFACAELLVSPIVHGLFSQVFLGSGAASARHNRSTAEAVRRITFDRLGIRHASDLMELSNEEILTAQQGIIEECYVEMPPEYSQANVLGLPYEHTIDGVSIVPDVARTLESGSRAGVPLLVGTTTGESRAHVAKFADDMTDEDAAAAYDGMVRSLGTTGTETVAAYRRMLPNLSAKGILAAINADLRFTLDSVRAARAQSPHAPTYRFVIGDYDPTFGGTTPHGGVQGHAWRTPEGRTEPDLKPQHRILNAATADFVHSAVSSFISTGVPTSETPGGQVRWTAIGDLPEDQVLLVHSDGYEIAREPSWDRLTWWGDRLERA